MGRERGRYAYLFGASDGKIQKGKGTKLFGFFAVLGQRLVG